MAEQNSCKQKIEMNTEKMLPIDYSSKITPPIIGDTVYNSKSNNTYILNVADMIIGFDNSNLFVVSFADRPYKVASHVGGAFVVIQSLTSWKPCHSSMLTPVDPVLFWPLPR